MPFREVIKNFDLVRSRIRDFYVYGFKRDGSDVRIAGKSKRSDSDERYRIESWLGDYLNYHVDDSGKSYFLSIDSRSGEHNPLFRVWKTSSFTDGDIVMHFVLMDILLDYEEISFRDLVDELSDYLDCDESTIRKKLKEYEQEGIVNKTLKGKTAYYFRGSWELDRVQEVTGRDKFEDILDYYSEVAPVGVIGSFIMDKIPDKDESNFSFKHHFINQTVDSDVLLTLFDCINNKRAAVVKRYRHKFGDTNELELIPLRLYCSSSTGRQYMMCMNTGSRKIEPLRMDYVLSVKPGDVCDRYDEYKETLNRIQNNIWGISIGNMSDTRHVTFTVEYSDKETYILQRLSREKRSGTVTVIDDNHARFDADVYDPVELFPWVRTFICRITSVDFGDDKINKRFVDDIRAMEAMYE